jgi:hypothetical protein
MKIRMKHLMLATLLAGTLVSCKNNAPKETRLIPKDALAVVTMDAFSLKEKLRNDGITIDTLLGKIFEKDSAGKTDRKIFDDLRNNAGINWKENLHFFVVQKKAADNSDLSVMNLLGSLQDAAKLESFIQNTDYVKNKKIQKEKEFSYIEGGENSLIVWNGENIIAMSSSGKVKPYYDTLQMKFIIPEKTDLTKEMLAEATRMFTQKEDASMRSVEGFRDMFKTKAAGYLFSTTNNLLGSLTGMPLQLPKLEELLKNNYSAATLAFEDGKIIASSTTYTNSFLGSILKKYAGPTVDISLINNYPSQHINGIMLASFNPEIFGGVLKQLEVEGLVNEFLKKSGISSQDLYASLKGDIAVVISDLGIAANEPQQRDDELSLVKRKPGGKMILNIPVGNKESFRKLMNKAAEMGTVQKTETGFRGADLITTLGLYLVANDQQLIIASDSVTYREYLQKTNKAVINPEARDYFKGKSTALYIDLANTIGGFMRDSTSDYYHSMLTAKNTVKDIMASSLNFEGGKIKAVFELRMQNEKQNSLVTLMSLFTNIAADTRLQAKREREMEEKLFPSGIPTVIRAN